MTPKTRRDRTRGVPPRAGAPPVQPSTASPPTAWSEGDERFRIISELTSDFAYAFSVTPAGTLSLEWMTDAFTRITGYRPDEFWPHGDWMTLLHPADLDVVLQRMARVLAGQPDEGEARIIAKSGAVRWLYIYSRPEWDPVQERVTRVYGAVRDITERKQTEAALRESQERYRTLAEASPDAIYIINHEGRVEYVNRAAAQLVGCKPADILGRPPEDFFAPGTFSRQAQNLQRVFQSGEPVAVEDRNIIAGRELWQDSLLVPLKDKDGRVRAVMGVSRDITGRKKIEEALRQSEHQYRTTIDGLLAFIHVVGPDLRILLCNMAMLRWLEEAHMDTAVIGRTVFEVFPFLPATVRDEYMHVFETGKMLLTEETTRVGEREIVTETRKIPVLEDGQVARVITVVLDITERKRAEQALRESEERYRTLVETSPDGITLTDLEGRILMVNRRAVELYGAESAAELLGRNALDLIAPSGRERAIANIRRALETGVVHGVEYEVLRKDGTAQPVELTAALLRDAWGRPQAFISVTRDISERKRAEEALWQTKMVVEHSPVILYRLRNEPGWPCDFVSENVDQSGYTTAELLSGQVTFTTLVHPDDLAWVEREMEEHGGHGPDTFRRSYRILLKDGRIAWVEDRVVVVRAPDGSATHFQGILLDVTENRRLEEQFRQAQKMETVGRLAGGIAHDFNNFLTAIRGYAGLVYDALRPEDPVRADVEQVLQAAERAASLTGQLLAFSRRQILEPRPVNLNDLVLETEKMLHRLIGEDIELMLDLTSALGRVRADPGQITQALVNLVVNARDAMPDGGVLTIATANLTLDQNPGDEHAGVPPGSFVMLTVSDTGVGMAPEVKAHLFEPFFTTKEAGRGTGLGLATVYGIVKQHEGYITIQSEPGRGTTVRIYLPTWQETFRAGTRRGTAASMPQGDETVLVVEDEPAVRALIVRVLRGLGYHVLEAGEGNAAIQVAREHKGPIHLLLTDIVMPQMDGKMLAGLLQDTYEGLRVLYVSGYATDVLANYGILEEDVSLLHKPFTGANLALKVREVLDA